MAARIPGIWVTVSFGGENKFWLGKDVFKARNRRQGIWSVFSDRVFDLPREGAKRSTNPGATCANGERSLSPIAGDATTRRFLSARIVRNRAKGGMRSVRDRKLLIFEESYGS